MTVRYTPEAIHDLQSLRDYIGKSRQSQGRQQDCKADSGYLRPAEEPPAAWRVCRGKNRPCHRFAFCNL